MILWLTFSNLAFLSILGFPKTFSVAKIFASVPLLLAGVLLLVFSFRGFLRFIPRVRLSTLVIFALLIFWSFVITARSILNEPASILSIIGNHTVAWPWFAPLIAVLLVVASRFDSIYEVAFSIVRASVILTICVFGLTLVSFETKSYWIFLSDISFVAIFCWLLRGQYDSSQQRVIIAGIFCYAVAGYFTSLRITWVVISIAFLGDLFITLVILFRRILKPVIRGPLFLLLSLAVVSAGYYVIDSNSRLNLFIDTRSFLFDEVLLDLSGAEYLTGRGVMGRYYSPFFASFYDQGLAGDSWQRLTVEVGYFKMLLKGGLLLVVLNAALVLNAILRGIRSNVREVQAHVLFCTIFFLGWMISFPNRFTPVYILLWASVGFLISRATERPCSK